MNLSVQIQPANNGSQRVAIGGRLDTHSYQELDRQLAPLLASAYDYADSAEHREGVSAFVEKRPPHFPAGGDL